MKATVVIPTHNRRELLEQAVETVRLQTHEDVELVVVDGGSTDGTREYLEGLDYDALQTVYHDSPRGLSNARNAGIEKSSGEYIAFLDSDDLLYPHAVDTLVGALERRDGCAGAFGSKKIVTQRGRVKERRAPEGIMTQSTFENAMSIGGPSATLFLRSALEEVGGFDESLPSREDIDLYLKVLKRYDLVGVDKFCCERRMHAHQISKDTESVREAHAAIAEKHGLRYSDDAQPPNDAPDETSGRSGGSR